MPPPLFQAAEESLVLLKNTDNVLPLAKGKKLLITGPNANSMRCLNGGWSYSWQGDKADLCAGEYNTILEAFTNKFGADNIIYEAGVTYKEGGNWQDENAPEIEKAVAAAANADYIVACIGENSYCETPGNLTNLFLSRNQLDLVKALAKTGKPVIDSERRTSSHDCGYRTAGKGCSRYHASGQLRWRCSGKPAGR